MTPITPILERDYGERLMLYCQPKITLMRISYLLMRMIFMANQAIKKQKNYLNP